MAKTIAALQVALDLESAQFVQQTEEAKRKARELGDTMQKTGAAGAQLGDGMKKAADAKRNFGDTARNVGYQVQDFAVQVGAGTSATQALAQQLPQLLSAFGAVGVVLGTIAAVAIPLVSAGFTALLGTMKSVEDSLSDVQKAASDFKSANDEAALSLKDLSDSYYDHAAPALKALAEQLREILRLKLGDKVRDFADSVINQYAGIGRLAIPEFVRFFMDTPTQKLAKDLGVTEMEAARLFDTLRQFQQQKIPFEDLRDQVIDLQLPFREATADGKRLREELIRMVTEVERAQSARPRVEIQGRRDAEREAEKAARDAERERERALKEEERKNEELRQYNLQRLRAMAGDELAAERQQDRNREEIENLRRRREERADREATDRLAQREQYMSRLQRRLMELQQGADAVRLYDARLQGGVEGEDLMRRVLSAERAKRLADEVERALPPMDRFKQELARINKEYDEGYLSFENYLVLMRKLGDDTRKAMEKPGETLKELIVIIDRTGEKFTDAFVQMAMTGRLEMSNMVDSIVADLMRMTVQAYITRPLFSFLTSSLGLPAPTARAEGGPVMGNTPYLVGERGPEIFVPRFNGTIVPNHQLGGQTTINNYNIQAIDTQSFEQRLMGSNKAIWAANAYASKSLSPAGARS